MINQYAKLVVLK